MLAPFFVVPAQRGVSRRVVVAMVLDASYQCAYRATRRVPRDAVGDNFSFNSILLSREGEGHGGDGIELVLGGRVPRHYLCANEQLDVLQFEWGIIAAVGVFSRAHEEEEGNTNHVSNGSHGIVRGGVTNV